MQRDNHVHVAFVGNPNCGKTTLFNAITGSKLKVANWPGVTVEKYEGTLEYEGYGLKLVDTPGIYSLTSYTIEEKVTRKCVLDDDIEVIVNVVDASCLERNLYLTLQLLELGKPVILALNMMDIVKERGMEIDMHRLPEMLEMCIRDSMYKKYGKIVSPMGCRAFLSPWYVRGGMHPADEKDEPVFVGRFNIGAVSLHLPMILAKARQESKDFYEVLDYYLNLIRQLHIRTYAYLGEMRASTNPLAYCEGGFLGGNLKLSDKIKPLLKSATASFGITALNELQMLYNGKSLVEDGQFALEVMEHINSKINEYKEEDGNLYAIYGTPAENLCGLQVKQFRNKYGIIEGLSLIHI